MHFSIYYLVLAWFFTTNTGSLYNSNSFQINFNVLLTLFLVRVSLSAFRYVLSGSLLQGLTLAGALDLARMEFWRAALLRSPELTLTSKQRAKHLKKTRQIVEVRRTKSAASRRAAQLSCCTGSRANNGRNLVKSSGPGYKFKLLDHMFSAVLLPSTFKNHVFNFCQITP